MAQSAEAYVQVPPNSTGSDIRMMQITVLEAGVPTTVLMQVVQIADENGNPVSFVTREQQMQEMLDEIRAVRLGIQELISAGAKPNEVINLIQVAREMRHEPDDPISDEE